MPTHDWNRVFAGTFHDFHSAWITHLKEALNAGLLPEEFYALAEQHAGRSNPDVLTLSTRQTQPPPAPPEGAVALAEVPPKVGFHLSADEDTTYRMMRRTLTIRHRSGRRIVAMIEVLSPGNKDREQHLEQFVDKAVAALQQGIHLLVIDVHPPGRWDPHGIHGAIWPIVGGGSSTPATDKPLTLAAYLADRLPEAFVEMVGVGDALQDMPLFLSTDWYVLAPLEGTYMAAYAGMPSIIKDVLEGRAPPETQED
jgi:hypothetical protein